MSNNVDCLRPHGITIVSFFTGVSSRTLLSLAPRKVGGIRRALEQGLQTSIYLTSWPFEQRLFGQSPLRGARSPSTFQCFLRFGLACDGQGCAWRWRCIQL